MHEEPLPHTDVFQVVGKFTEFLESNRGKVKGGVAGLQRAFQSLWGILDRKWIFLSQVVRLVN